MARMHSHRHAGSGGGGGAEEAASGGNLNVERMAQLEKVRSKLRDKATGQFKETVLTSLLIFRQMLSSEDYKETSKKLDLDIGGKIVDGLVDKLKEKVLETLKESLGLAGKLGGILTASFSTVQETIKGNIATRGRLTALEVADSIVNHLYAAMDKYCAEAGAVVDGLSYGELNRIRLELAEGRGKADADDSELADGLETAALERVGLPQTGGAMMHELAKLCMAEFLTEVRATKPVREQVDEIQHIGEQPAKIENEAEEAEQTMDPSGGLTHAIKADQHQRERAGGES